MELAARLARLQEETVKIQARLAALDLRRAQWLEARDASALPLVVLERERLAFEAECQALIQATGARLCEIASLDDQLQHTLRQLHV